MDSMPSGLCCSDAADVVAELPTASFRQKSEVYDGLISDFAADLPNVPYGYEWMVKVSRQECSTSP